MGNLSLKYQETWHRNVDYRYAVCIDQIICEVICEIKASQQHKLKWNLLISDPDILKYMLFY